MTLKLTSSAFASLLFCFVTSVLVAQTADSLKRATLQEKSETLLLRMGKELMLTEDQSVKLREILTARFDALGKESSEESFAPANEKALAALKGILTEKQYAQYNELRVATRREKERFLREHPGYKFSREDIEMDF